MMVMALGWEEEDMREGEKGGCGWGVVVVRRGKEGRRGKMVVSLEVWRV